ncbi:MAG TPA: sugar phosphate nucleotidyltransferase [Planctomycetota bacterium]|jgi:mannose-1-phosphate guanylyltransferase|nr:sugar phosphate nucleotidyltransferase [Planctomycetota bacterium]
MHSKSLWAVLLAGGSGTRFWPASRRALPKQFLPIGGTRSLLAATAARLRGLVPWERTLVVTAREQVPLVRKHLRKLPPDQILAEPAARNTAAAVAWAATEIERRDPGSVHAVLPSDHTIAPAADFRKALRAAAEEAEASGALLTFGIRPTFAATGYGWIEVGSPTGERRGESVSSVVRFVEKPDRPRAEAFLAGGRHLWNSGMFVWRTDAILRALREHAPALAEAFANARDAGALDRVYAGLPSVSIDVAVLERSKDVRVIPARFGWSDVGSWSALAEVLDADGNGNLAAGGVQVLAEEAQGCTAWGRKGELTVLFGVRDLVVVRAGKATLVCPRERSQELKKIVDRLAKDGPSFL